MHRTDKSPKGFQQAPISSTYQVESGKFSASSHDTACSSFVPLHYESGYAYPLIVWLHSELGDERQLTRVMPLVSMRNYVAVAPRGVRLDAANAQRRGSYGWPQSEGAIRQAEQHVFDAIETAQRKFNVCRRRVFVAGFGSGGTMAFRVAMNHPSQFAGVLSFCGAFPSGGNPLSNLAEARQLAIFLAVGRRSRQYPTAAVCDNLRLFHTAGLSTTLRQYPCDQELSPQMLIDMDRWIIEQIASEESPDAASDKLWSNELD